MNPIYIMTQEPRLIQASDIQFLDEGRTRAVCISMSDQSQVYHMNLIERTCECKGFQYCKKEPKECKHITSALRLKSIMESGNNP